MKRWHILKSQRVQVGSELILNPINQYISTRSFLMIWVILPFVNLVKMLEPISAIRHEVISSFQLLQTMPQYTSWPLLQPSLTLFPYGNSEMKLLSPRNVHLKGFKENTLGKVLHVYISTSRDSSSPSSWHCWEEIFLLGKSRSMSH